MFNLVTEYSLWYILICFLIGIGLSYLLYSQKSVFEKKLNIFLAVLRAILISFLCFLLMGPLLKYIKKEFEKPIFIFLLDDSQSISLTTDTNTLVNMIESLKNTRNKLVNSGYQVKIKTLNQKKDLQSISDVIFNGNITDISGKLRSIESIYEHNNLASIILVSDGIFNRGISPEYYQYTRPIYTLGLGDTIPSRDIQIKTVYTNKIAYLDNRFPLIAEIHHNGFSGKKIQIELYHKNKLVESKEILLEKDYDIKSVEFLALAKETGIQSYQIVIKPFKEELTDQNNSKLVYVDILDSREKILLIAAVPHPDIKALKYAIEKNKNYDLSIHILSVAKEPFQHNQQYDLAIFHQIPNNISNPIIDKFTKIDIPIWYILGSQSNISYFNRINGLLKLNLSSKTTDRVTPSFSDDFELFTFDKRKKQIIQKFPPVMVHFGNYQLSGKSKVLIYQQVGNIITKKPLLVVGEENNKKIAVMTGEGLWQWRLQEYLFDRNHETFDELITKMVQYLSAKKDKRKFKVYSTNYEYNELENVILKTEVYNEIYESISGQEIKLNILDEEGLNRTFTYVNTTNSFRYPIKGLPKGSYNFVAEMELNGKKLQSTGRFTIKATEVEALNTQADFNILRNISKESGGNFYSIKDIELLENDLTEQEFPDIIHIKEAFSEIIQLPWLMFIIISWISIEWLLRKIKGGY